MCPVPCRSQLPCLDHSNNICCTVLTIKLLSIHFSLPSCYFLPLDRNALLSTPYSNNHSRFCSLNVTDQVSHPQQQQPKYDSHSVHMYLDIHECCTLWSRCQSQCSPSHQRLEEDCYRFYTGGVYHYYMTLNRDSSLTTLTCINTDLQ
jgi:hypothetical protein